MLFTVHMQRGTISAALFAGVARVVYSENFEVYTNMMLINSNHRDSSKSHARRSAVGASAAASGRN